MQLETDYQKMLLLIVLNEARLATTGASDIKINKEPGQVSTNMRVLTNKDGLLISFSDQIKENEIKDTSLRQINNNNHTVAAQKNMWPTTTKTHFSIL